MSETTPEQIHGRARSARDEQLSAEYIAPGLFQVRNADSGSEYTVDARDGACGCPDFEFRMGPAGGECKHLAFVRHIAGETTDDLEGDR